MVWAFSHFLAKSVVKLKLSIFFAIRKMLPENQEENIKWFLQRVENKPQGAIPEKSNIHISPHGIEGMIPHPAPI